MAFLIYRKLDNPTSATVPTPYTDVWYWEFDSEYFFVQRYPYQDTSLSAVTPDAITANIIPGGVEVLRGDSLTRDELTAILFKIVRNDITGVATPPAGGVTAANQLSFNNTNAQLPGPPGNVQAAIDQLDALTDSRLQGIAPTSGSSVLPNQIVLLAGRLWRNPTTATIIVPAVINLTTLPSAGLEEFALIAEAEVIVGTADLTGVAPIGAKYGRNITTGAEFDVVAGNWVPAFAVAATIAPYLDLPTGGAIAVRQKTRLTPGQGYTLPIGIAGDWVDLAVPAVGVAPVVTPAATNTISGVVGAYAAPLGSSPRFYFNGTNWEVYGVSATAAANTFDYSNWVTFKVSAEKIRPSGETYAAFILAKIGNTVVLPVEAGLTAGLVSGSLGIGTIAPITLAVTGGKPVTVRTPSATTTLTDAQLIPVGLYATSYNGTVIVLDQMEGAALAAVNTTPVSLAGLKGQSQRVNAAETAMEFFTSGGSLVGSATTFAALPTSNGLKTAITGDYAFLSAKDGINEIGFYKYNGSAYAWGFSIALPATSLTGLKGQQQRVNAAETALEFFTQNGSLLGSAATFATLPKVNGGKAAINGDWAYLSVATQGNGTVAAPQYPIGFYRYDGTDYQYSFSVSVPAAPQILDAWFGTANADWDKYGLTSFRQMIFAIGKTQLWLDPATTYDWNNIYTRLEGLVGWNVNAEHTNAPANTSTGFSGFATRTGTTANGKIFMFVASGPSVVTGLWHREISGGTWLNWTKFAGDEWQNVTSTYQAASGARIRVSSGVAVTLAYSGTNDAIRVVPKTTWADVPTLVASQGYTVSGQPATGSEEVVFLPDTSAKVWEAKMAVLVEKPTAPTMIGAEIVKPADLRNVSINGARCLVRYGGTANRILPADANTIDGLLIEFQNGWRLISQQTIPSFIDDTWYPIGFEIKNAGSYYKRRVDGISQLADLTNTALWDPLSSAVPLATGATATANGTAGSLPAAPMGVVTDYLGRDGTYRSIPVNGPLIGMYTPDAALPVGTNVPAGGYYIVVSDGTLALPITGVTLRAGDELVALRANPALMADWYVRVRATSYQAGTAAMVIAGDTIEHVYTGAELGNSIRQVISNLGGISNYTSLASLTYGATVAGGLRYAISIANNKIYRATAATISNRALDPSINPTEWETINEFNSFPFTAGTTLDFAPLELEAQSLVFIHSSTGAPQELKFKAVTSFGKKIIVDGIDVTAAMSAGVTTVANVTKGLLYQNFTNQSATSGTTYFVDLSSSIGATCPNLANSESVTFGMLRSVLIGGTTRAYIRYGGSVSPRTTDAAATTTGLLTEFNNGWNFVCQSAIPLWAINVIYPIGFNVSDGIKIYENLITATSAVNDLTDAAKWRVVGNIANYLIRDIIPAGSTLTMLDLREYIGTAGSSGTATPKLATATSSQQHVEFINADGGTYTIGLTTATDTLNGVANGTIVSNTKGEHLQFICTAAGTWLETSAKSGFLSRGTITAAVPATLSNLFEYAGTAGAGVAAAPKLPTAGATTTEQRIEFIGDGGVYTFGLATATDTLNGVANGTIVSRRKGERLVFVGRAGAWQETNRISLNDSVVGLIQGWPGAAVPNDGWLPMSGGVFNDVDYPELALMIRSGAINITASTTANTFTLRNYNTGAAGGLGYFLGGLGGQAAGTLQDDATVVNGLVSGAEGGHTHALNYSDGGGGAGRLPGGGGDAIGSVQGVNGDMTTAPNHVHSLTSTDAETRPYTARVLWCVRAKPSPVVLGDNATLVVNNQTIRHTVTFNNNPIGLASEFTWSIVRVPVTAGMEIDTVSPSIGTAYPVDRSGGLVGVIAPIGGGTINITTTERSLTVAVTVATAALSPAVTARLNQWTLVKVPVTSGRVITAVAISGGTAPQASIRDGVNGFINVLATTAAVDLTLTESILPIYNGVQSIFSAEPTPLLLTTAAQNYVLGAVLREGDRITVWGDYNDLGVNTQVYTYWVKAGRTIRGFAWPVTDHNVSMIFPATLTNTVQVLHGAGNNAFRLKGYRIERDTAYGVAVPTATTIATDRKVTALRVLTGTLAAPLTTAQSNVDGVAVGVAQETWGRPIGLAMPADQEIDQITCTNGTIAKYGTNAAWLVAGAGNVAITYTTKGLTGVLVSRTISASTGTIENGLATATGFEGIGRIIKLDIASTLELVTATTTNGSVTVIGVNTVYLIPTGGNPVITYTTQSVGDVLGLAYLRLTADLAGTNLTGNLTGTWAAEAGFTNSITQATGSAPGFLLKTGKRYRLKANLYGTGVDGAEYLFANWWNKTDSVDIAASSMGGLSYDVASGTREPMGSPIEAIFIPTKDTEVVLRIQTWSGTFTISAESNTRSTSLYCEELPSSYRSPNGFTNYVARGITGSVTAIGRDATAISLVIPSLPANQELDVVTAPGGTPLIEDRRSGRITITPNGADVAVTHTTRFWRRLLTATTNVGGGSTTVANVNGAASTLVEVGRASNLLVTLPVGSYITGVAATNGTAALVDPKGIVSVTPDNVGDMTINCTIVSNLTIVTATSGNVNGVASATVTNGESTRVLLTIPANQRLTTVTANNGATVTIADGRTGAVDLFIPIGVAAVALTVATVVVTTPNAPVVTDFLASGTWIPTAGMIHARIIGVGGGGSGGYGFGSAGANQIYAGCGGYGGAEIDLIVTAAQAGASVPITIGAGGTVGNAGGNTLIGAAGAIAVANGGGSGGGQYSYCDGSLTSCSVAPVNGAATFAINIGRDVGSKEGSYPSVATMSIQAGTKGSFALSQGGRTRFSEGTRPLRLSTPHLTGAGGINSTAGAANTGSGGSGDCVYSCNGTTGAGGSSGAAGGSGRVRIIEYF
jgi:hypothetical protein